MGRLLKAELKKLHSLNIWWLVLAGGILPEIITYLTLYNQDKLEWLTFTNMSLSSFSVQSLLTFATFATYIWAREYEENTMEMVLCYPYPRFFLILIKVVVLLFVILLTTAIFFATTLIVGRGMFETMMPQELFWKLTKALFHSDILHFLLIPMYLCIAMVTKSSISGLIYGITNMCICFILGHTSFVQYIPQCIPYVIGDNQLGMKSLIVDHSLWVYYSIVIVLFMISLAVTKVLTDRLKK
jgi:hypothetical protein